MLESMNFNFNDESSRDYGVVMVTTSTGLYEDLFLATRSIIEEKTPYNPAPYFMGTQLETLSFPLTLHIEDWEKRNSMRKIARWLFQPSYRPISFESNDGIFYDVMFVDDSSKFHNGCKDGYITLNVKASSPFGRSETKPVDFANTNAKPSTILINNDGDLEVFPRMTITKSGSTGDIKITNKTSNKITILSGIVAGEIVEIDFKIKDITSSLESQNIYRYNNFNNEWLVLLPKGDNFTGENELLFEGNFEVKMEYELQYLTEDYPLHSLRQS